MWVALFRKQSVQSREDTFHFTCRVEVGFSALVSKVGLFFVDVLLTTLLLESSLFVARLCLLCFGSFLLLLLLLLLLRRRRWGQRDEEEVEKKASRDPLRFEDALVCMRTLDSDAGDVYSGFDMMTALASLPWSFDR